MNGLPSDLIQENEGGERSFTLHVATGFNCLAHFSFARKKEVSEDENTSDKSNPAGLAALDTGVDKNGQQWLKKCTIKTNTEENSKQRNEVKSKLNLSK